MVRVTKIQFDVTVGTAILSIINTFTFIGAAILTGTYRIQQVQDFGGTISVIRFLGFACINFK